MFKPRKRRETEPVAQNEVLSSIKGSPSTYKEINERTGRPVVSIRSAMGKLKKKGIADTVTLGLSRSSRTYSFYPYELVGELAGETIAYFCREGTLLGKRIIQHMPEEVNPEMKKSITWRLVSILPDDAKVVVRDYMREHVVCRYPFDTSKYEVKITNPRGEFAHENHPASKYATDFKLPLNTPLFAAHEGTVFRTKLDSDRHFTSEDVKEKGWKLPKIIEMALEITNYVCMKHDGIYFDYFHLEKDGVVVEENQKVEKGDLLGYVGMSGFTETPHLHFNAYKFERNKPISIPVRFIE